MATATGARRQRRHGWWGAIGRYHAESSLPFRRSQRVGLRAGAEIEDFGVRRNYEYRMTRMDLLKDNRDLLEHVAGLLASGKLPVQQA